MGKHRRFSRGKGARRSSEQYHLVDGTFQEQTRRPKVPKKALQLCAQISDALQYAISGDFDDIIRDLTLVEVSQYGDSSRVLVTVALPRGSTAEDITTAEEHLARARGRFRSEIAASITRKRTPDLVFQVLRTDANGDLSFF